jgi:hypothetical protein
MTYINQRRVQRCSSNGFASPPTKTTLYNLGIIVGHDASNMLLTYIADNGRPRSLR